MITHEKATDKNIITKQVVINTPTSARLLPITADEKVIDEIQQALNELERLKKQEKLLEKLAERDTPKKVCYDNVGRSECPSCDKFYLYNGSMNRNKYCGYCGQRLEWGYHDK